MDALLFHPKIVHLPIALAVLMPLIAGGLLLAWWRGWLPHRAWLVAIGLQVVLVTSGIAALRTGEVDEERVEPIVAERLIEEHEEAAEVFVAASGVVLGLMLLAGVLRRPTAALPLAGLAAIGTVVVLSLGYRTGQAGGSLVYTHGAASAYATQASALDGAGGQGDRDDD